MKQALTIALAAAVTIVSTATFAASASGVVKNVDSSHDSITLSDGMVFVLAEGSEAEDFKPGTKVAVTFSKKHGDNVATSVKILK